MTRRSPAVYRIRQEHTEIRKVGRGSYTLRLKIDHQSFQINEMGHYESRRHALWIAKQLAIALHRFKFGDGE